MLLAQQVIMNLDVRVAEGNQGAIGLHCRGAQGSGLEDVAVYLADGLVGVVGGAGSGGAHHGITVVGGRYGMDLRYSQPAGSMSGITLTNQTCGAFPYEGFESLTAVGVRISGLRGCNAILAGGVGNVVPSLEDDPACGLPDLSFHNAQPTNAAISGSFSLVDSSVEFADGAGSPPCASRAVVKSTRGVLLRNVYVRNANDLGQFPSGTSPLANCTSKGGGGGWCRVLEFAHTANAPPTVGGFQYRSMAFVDGKEVGPGHDASYTAEALPAGGAPPPDLVARHGWGGAAGFPSPTDTGVINVRLAPYNATGDGFVDDWAAIQQAVHDGVARGAPVLLPRGVYAISRTLVLPQGAVVLGVARHLSRIVSVDGGLRQGASKGAGAPGHTLSCEDGGGSGGVPCPTQALIYATAPATATATAAATSAAQGKGEGEGEGEAGPQGGARAPGAAGAAGASSAGPTILAFFSVTVWNNDSAA